MKDKSSERNEGVSPVVVVVVVIIIIIIIIIIINIMCNSSSVLITMIKIFDLFV